MLLIELISSIASEFEVQWACSGWQHLTHIKEVLDKSWAVQSLPVRVYVCRQCVCMLLPAPVRPGG